MRIMSTTHKPADLARTCREQAAATTHRETRELLQRLAVDFEAEALKPSTHEAAA